MADYPLRKNVGRGLAGLSRASNRKIDPREVQAMFADLASGVGVPLADAGAKYLRGDVEGAKESAAIEGALSAIPAVALAAKPVYRAAKKAVPGVLETTRQMAEEAIERGTPMGQMLEAASPSYVIKPKGGNWMSANYNTVGINPEISNYKIPMSQYIADYIPDIYKVHDEFSKAGGDVGGQSGFMRWLEQNYPQEFSMLESSAPAALNRWVDQKLGKYITNEMGTSEDPLRLLLQERGISHLPTSYLKERGDDFLIDVFNYGTDNVGLARRRTTAGFPAQGEAHKEFLEKHLDPAMAAGHAIPGEQLDDLLKRYGAAGGWEVLADRAIKYRPAADVISGRTYMGSGEITDKYPWMAKLDPFTPMYAIDDQAVDSLGFRHLTDQLRGAMSANTLLPPELRITPKQLDKMTMAQAVERVSKINDWTSEQAARAEREGMLANLKAAPRASDESLNLSFVKEPGGKWVDIPEVVDEKGMKLCTSIGKAGGWCTQDSDVAREYGSGNNRLVALLDSEGRPHLQAKLTTGTMFENRDDVLRHIPEAEEIVLRDNPGIDLLDHDAIATVEGVAAKLARDRMPPSITELKPPENSMGSSRVHEYAKRDPEYRQKISDSALNFLNSGEWGRVNDLDHFNIVDTHPVHGNWEEHIRSNMVSEPDSRKPSWRDISAIARTIKEDNPDMPRFVKSNEYRDLLNQTQGYAEGGSVTRPASPGFNFEHISILADAL